MNQHPPTQQLVMRLSWSFLNELQPQSHNTSTQLVPKHSPFHLFSFFRRHIHQLSPVPSFLSWCYHHHGTSSLWRRVFSRLMKDRRKEMPCNSKWMKQVKIFFLPYFFLPLFLFFLLLIFVLSIFFLLIFLLLHYS